jgi:hypothetical protein
MKLAITAVPALRMPARPSVPMAVLYRFVGLLLAVGVPVVFWTSAVAIVSRALGIDIGAAGLAAWALAVGTVCFVAASAVMVGRTKDT